MLGGVFLAQVVSGEVRRSDALQRAEAAWATPVPDMSLWSESRKSAWVEARRTGTTDLLAVLDIPDLDLEVPVYASASDLDMDRGAGWIPGTSRPGELGNIGIAGHRDGYFRVLKDAEVGDRMELRTPLGPELYQIDDIFIVDPLDVEILDPTDEQTITIVTCYPFYFAGSAPKRYIVRASRVALDSSRSSAILGSTETSAETSTGPGSGSTAEPGAASAQHLEVTTSTE